MFNLKQFFIILIAVGALWANFPYRGTVKTSTGQPIEGAAITALVNAMTSSTGVNGNFGQHPVNVSIESVLKKEIKKPVLRSRALYYNAEKANIPVTFRIYDMRGRVVIQKNTMSTKSGMNVFHHSLNLANGLYVVSLQVGKLQTAFKTLLDGRSEHSGVPMIETSIMTQQGTSSRLRAVSLVDTLYVKANGYKTKKVAVADTGNVGLITLELANSDPEIACTKIFMGYTPQNYPSSTISSRGDTVILGMNLANYGASNALSVSCSLSTTDPNVTFIESVAGFNNIVQGDTMPQLNFFKMLIPRDLSEGHQISFKLYISDSWGGEWEDAYIYMPYPVIVTHQKVDSDELGYSATKFYDDWGYPTTRQIGSLKRYHYVEYTPLLKNVSGADLQNISARIFNYAYTPVETEEVKTVGNLLKDSSSLTQEDFVLLANWDTYVPETEGDLLLQENDTGDYYLVPVMFNGDKPEPATSAATIKGVDISLEYCEDYYPLVRGDLVYLRTGLTNIGTELAYSVSCSLSTSESRITIEEPLIAYDNIAPGDTVKPLHYRSLDSLVYWHYDTLYNPVHKVHIPRDFPAGETIPFALHIKDSWGGTWIDTIHYMPYPFIISADMIDDDQTPDSDGNDDGIVNNGETIEYTPQLQNVSVKNISNVVALFTDNLSYIVRDTDDKWNYGNFSPDQKQLPELDYVFTVISEDALVNGLYQNDLLVTATVDGREQNFLVPVDLRSGNYGIPTVTLTGSDTSVSTNTIVTFTAVGNDYDGTIEKFVWAKDGINFTDTTTTGSFQAEWDYPKQYTVLVKAIDNNGNASASVGFTVLVKSDPNLFANIGIAQESVLLSSGNVVTAMISTATSKEQIGVMEFFPDGTPKWSRIYEHTNGSRAAGLKRVDQNGYVVVGTKLGSDTTLNDIWLLRLDNFGDTLWTKTLGGSKYEYATAIEVLSDGFVIAGVSCSYSSSDDMLFIKTDRQGNVIWTRNIGTSNNDLAGDIKQTADGKFIATGYYNAYEKDFGNFTGIVHELALVKLSSTGVLEWAKRYTGGGLERGFSVDIASNGDYIIGASTNSIGHWSGQGWILRCNNNGDSLWTTMIGDSSDAQFCSSVKEMDDGSFIGTGYNMNFDPFEVTTIMYKVSSTGSVLWEFNYGASASYGVDVQKVDGNSVIVSGQSGNYPIVFKVSTNGSVIGLRKSIE